MRTATLIVLYLAAIVIANLAVTYGLERFGVTGGVAASITTAFLLIGLDITARDALHERWYRRGLVWKMGALIASGSVISALINIESGRIAAASFVSFAVANLADALVYHVLHRRPRLLKINGSNVVTSLVDSLLFPTLAFGAVMPLAMLAEFVAKAGGGFVWSLILRRRAFEGEGVGRPAPREMPG
jgi:uncharacterized PurR-regulated membrane protein YhhQ (DUF165 family)